MTTPVYIPIDPSVAPTNASGFLLDFDMQFTRMAMSPVEDWHTRFAYMPPGASEDLEVRMPVDLSTYGFEEYNGIPTFRGGARTYIDVSIGKFWEGAFLDTRKLRAKRSEEIEAWNQRAAAIFDAYARFLPPKIFDLLDGGEAAISGGHPITGGAGFFATDHYVNKKKTSLGTFSNLISNGGALASSPIYFMWSGGAFDRMRPWQIRTGAGPADSLTRGGITHSATSGAPWVVRWIPREDSEVIEQNFQVKVGVYVEKGFGLLFPHTCWRYEGALDYAGLKGVIDLARAMKDLNGYNPASSIKLDAILCAPGQVSTINGLLGREVTDTGARQVDLRIDATLQGAAVIPMSR